MPVLLRRLQWTLSQNSHSQEDMTPFLQSQIPTAQRCQSLSPVMRPLTQKESPCFMSTTSSLIMAFPKRSFLIEMSVLYRNSHQNSAVFLTSNRTSAWHITLKQMEQVSEPIKHLNSICVSFAVLNTTTGTHGSHLPNTPRTLGLLQP